MQDKVGKELPSAEQVAEAIATLRQIVELLKPFTVTLTKEERVRALKPRTGGEAVARDVADVAEEFNVSVPGATPAGVRGDVTLVERLMPLYNEAASLEQLLSDTLTEASSEYWWGTTALYTVLARAAGADAKLEARLRPVVGFFARRRRGSAPEPGPTT